MHLPPDLLYGGVWVPLAGLSVAALTLYLWQSRAARKLANEKASLAAAQEATSLELKALKERFKDVLDIEAEKHRVEAEASGLRVKIEAFKPVFLELQARADAKRRQLAAYDDDLESIDFGLYKKHYAFDTSEKFKAAIDAVREKQKEMIKADSAVVGAADQGVIAYPLPCGETAQRE